ncbi:class I SAM-dependent methyltransferase [Clostridia bacterium]|nr:class I SAM-dependent methyltransferase [Clostridia bacterium]
MQQDNYVEKLLKHLLPLQEDILRDERQRDDVCPSVGKELGRMLHLLILATRPQKVLEIGTSMGYAAIWMGTALKQTGGKLITIEYHERLVNEARINLEKAGLSDVVSVHQGMAEDLLDELEGPFGLILQDGGTRTYKETLDKLVDKLPSGGLLVADDVLFAIHAQRERPKQNMSDFNRRLFERQDLFSTILSVGDGLSLSVKK